jgi:Protein of unknown function (DUF3551)
MNGERMTKLLRHGNARTRRAVPFAESRTWRGACALFPDQEDTMKILSFAAILIALGTVTAEAQQGQNGRYCYTSQRGATNCGFTTRAQCEASRRGNASAPCVRNPMYRGR